MSRSRWLRLSVVAVLVVITAVGGYLAFNFVRDANRTHVVAYFDNSNGIFVNDDVLIRGVAVGKIDDIEPEPNRVKISFWIAGDRPVPADAKAVILSPTLVTARAIQLTPPYSGGDQLRDKAVIPQQRTAVPVEWDDIRKQLERLTQTLQPTQPNGVSTLGSLIETTADNLRGRGTEIRNTVVNLSKTLSALGDHSGDIFTSVKNLSLLVSGLQDSTQLLKDLNTNLASVSGLLANDPNEVASALRDLNDVVGEVKTFVADNRESLGTTSDKLASLSTTLTDSLDDIKQVLHVLPNTAQNAVNIYQPAQGTLTGIASVNNFANPISFICGAVEAASRQGAEQSSKLCVQYLAPIIKNRQYNFLPFGLNAFVGTSARPNEVTYSEDWMRPDYVPPPITPASTDDGGAPSPPPAEAPLAAEAPLPERKPTDPTAGLPGMMSPAGAGS